MRRLLCFICFEFGAIGFADRAIRSNRFADFRYNPLSLRAPRAFSFGCLRRAGGLAAPAPRQGIGLSSSFHSGMMYNKKRPLRAFLASIPPRVEVEYLFLQIHQISTFLSPQMVHHECVSYHPKGNHNNL